MQTLLEAPGFVLTHDADRKILQLLWRGTQDEALVRAYLAVVLYHVRATHSTGILTDGTLDTDGWGSLTYWLADDYFQSLADNGIKALAWVVSRNLQARIDMNEVLVNVTRPMTDSFADTEAAYSWLRTVI